MSLRAAALGLAASLTALPLLAQTDEPRPTLAEVMDGATAMTTVANAYVFVAKPGESWLCALNLSSNHFVALLEGDTVVADQTVPSALCVPTTHFKNAVE
ncbi:MAG TPA: hypothetical protein ENK63_04730 [Rhodobacterales bacterium]|nr:hypothetical protein [Rhodobacterales bacterium]